MLGFALPYLAEDLEPSSTQQLWIVDIYSFMLAGLLVLMGTVGDRIGRRRLLLTGAAAFGAASVLAAFSTSPAMRARHSPTARRSPPGWARRCSPVPGFRLGCSCATPGGLPWKYEREPAEHPARRPR